MAPQLYHFERVASTMDVIHALAEQGAEAGTMVIADEQFEGRGSRGRSWHSAPGGLWMSALFRPSAAAGIEVLSLRVGLAVARTLDCFVPRSVRLKWPNDLMLGERKVGGILCEARWQGEVLGWVAVGVGLNVRNPVPADLRLAATSLGEEQPDIRDEDVRVPLVAALRSLELGGERLSDSELAELAARSWLHGREIREPLSGRVTGLADDGALRVRTPEGSDVALRNATIEVAGIPHLR